MFAKKPNKKIDPRVRYQHVNFTKKLDQARHYKRQAKPIEYSGASFLHGLGLKTKFSQILFGLILLGILYLIYVPNFLFVKNIEVQGVAHEEANRIEGRAQDYLDSTAFYNPQKNLLFLRKASLANYLQLDSKVLRVAKIDKQLSKGTLSITIEPKVERYTLRVQSNVYSLYNDGTVAQQLNIDTEQWLNFSAPTLKLKFDQVVDLPSGSKFLSDDLLRDLDLLRQNLKEDLKLDLEYIEIPLLVPVNPEESATATTEISGEILTYQIPLNPDDVFVYLKKPQNTSGNPPSYRVIFDTKKDLSKALEQLKLLLTQMALERYRNLYYIDMRFENRSFICLVGTPCAE
jgi:hypothetical protein